MNEIDGLNVNFDAASLDVDVKGDLFLDVFNFDADNLPRDIAALFAMYVGLLPSFMHLSTSALAPIRT